MNNYFKHPRSEKHCHCEYPQLYLDYKQTFRSIQTHPNIPSFLSSHTKEAAITNFLPTHALPTSQAFPLYTRRLSQNLYRLVTVCIAALLPRVLPSFFSPLRFSPRISGPSPPALARLSARIHRHALFVWPGCSTRQVALFIGP